MNHPERIDFYHSRNVFVSVSLVSIGKNCYKPHGLCARVGFEK